MSISVVDLSKWSPNYSVLCEIISYSVIIQWKSYTVSVR